MYQLEAPRRLSTSMLWRLITEYYENLGGSAWTEGDVPSRISTNPFIADAYAQIVAAYLRDVAVQHGGTSPAPTVTIIELGAGPGHFGFLFVRALRDAIAALPGSAAAAGFRYLMTDVAESNVAEWRSDPSIKSMVDDGVVDLAVLDVDAPAAARSALSGRSLGDIVDGGPVVMIGNYLFDSLIVDAFRVEAGEVFEVKVGLDLDYEPKSTVGSSQLFRQLKFRQEKAPIRWPYYPEPDFDAILQAYRTELSTTTLLFPVAGLRCVDAIRQLAGGRLLLLVGDKARSTVAQLEGHDSLSLRLTGSFSSMVNIDAIARWVARQGSAATMRTPSYERFDTYCFTMGGIGDGGETEAAFAKHVQCFGPNEFHWIESAIRHSDARWEPRAMLSLLALSRYDPYLVLRLEPALHDAIGAAGAGERAQFVLPLEKSRANIFPPADPWDMPVAIGRLFQTLGEPRAALDCYAESVARHGPRSALAYRISRCHGDLGDAEGAVASLREALELGRREGGAHRED